MPWKEIDAVDQRALFVEEVLKKRKPLLECCAQFGVSRKTAYKYFASSLRVKDKTRNGVSEASAGSWVLRIAGRGLEFALNLRGISIS